MNTSLLLIPAALLCLAVGCSSNPDSNAAPYSGDGDSSGGASGSRSHIPTGPSRAGSGGGVGDGGAATNGEGGEGGEAGEGGLQQGMVVVVKPSTCSEAANWTAAAPVMGVSTTSDEKLLSITADELDIVFARDGALLHAHRATATAAFDAGTAITLPDGYSEVGGASLSADGKTLVVVQTDGLGFAALTRASRTADFGMTADPSAFVGLNARAVQTQEHCAAPVLAPDGKSLVFAAYSLAPGATARVYESLLSSGAWAMPEDVSYDIFDGTTEKRALPSGLSADSRTLFYYDEATSKQAARFRDRPDAPLYTVVDLGDRVGAIPNAACDHVYYTSNGNVLEEAN
ncbi:MAG: hypothetical protein ABI548_06895 [Polyangiaceae bacterium]